MSRRIELLNKSRHDRAGFDCGIHELNDYLARRAAQHYRRGIATTHVLVNDEQPAGTPGLQPILGFYSLSAAQLALVELSEAERARLPRWPVPAVRMGQMAVDKSMQRCGIGELLVADAVKRSLRARETMGAVALIVDALNDQAAAFYQRYGFMACSRAPMSYYLFLGPAGS